MVVRDKVTPEPEASPQQTVTIEAAFRAGYHCQWIKTERRYLFDANLTPGDPDGAYWAWLVSLGRDGRQPPRRGAGRGERHGLNDHRNT